jgi:hypothetical protein
VVRQDIYGADSLAWALFKASQYKAAAALSEHALALGTRDALLYYHAGMIAVKQGKTGA